MPTAHNDQPERFIRYFSFFANKHGWPSRDLSEHGWLHFSDPTKFNDPFDVLPSLTNALDIVAAQATRRELRLDAAFAEHQLTDEDLTAVLSDLHPHWRATRSEIIRNPANPFQRLVSEQIRMICLTTSERNHLFWAHYAASHTGFAVELNFHVPPLNALSRFLQPVTYTNQRPQWPVDSVLSPQHFLSKSEHWEYEDERRVVVLRDDPKTDFVQLEPSSIKSLYLGCKCDKTTVPDIDRFLRFFSCRFPEAKMFQMKPDDRTYDLNPHPMPTSSVSQVPLP